MNTNALADEVYTALSLIHPRVYRNKSPQSPTSPYVVYNLESLSPSTPSFDGYLNVDVYDRPDVSVRAMNDLADDIVNELEGKVIITDVLNAHIVLEQRQFVSNTDLVEAQMINLRFVVRTYFK